MKKAPSLYGGMSPSTSTSRKGKTGMETVLKGMGKEVVIAHGRPTVILGERINPTGKKKLAAALSAGDLGVVRQEALAQVDAGANLLDVNVGAAGVDEVDLLPKAVKLVLETVDVPVCIDTPDGNALGAALAVHREHNPDGKPLVNSVNGEEASLARVLPLVAEYGAAVIGLCMDDSGISPTPEGRLSAGEKILERADTLNIPKGDILLDCLTLGVGADQAAGMVTLKSIRLVKEKLGVNQALGASNISYGLPDRTVLNSAFLVMAILEGVNCPIVDPATAGPCVLAADLVLGRDKFAMRYIQDFRRRKGRGFTG